MKVLLLLLLAGAARSQEQVFHLPLFRDGLYTRYSANAIPDGALAESLNVLLDQDVDGVVVARSGYAKYNTSAITASKTVRGLWAFDASDGTKYLVALSSQSFYSTSGDGTWTAIAGLNSFSATKEFDCVQTIGKLYCANSDTVFSWDGTSTATISGAPLGNLVGRFRNRLLMAGVSGSKARLRGSGELDPTDWTLQIPGVSTTPFNIAFGGADDGEDITCLMGAFQDVFLVGKRNSLWGLYGFGRNDFQTREISREVGCIESRSVKEKNNCLYWMSLRGMEKFCGSQIERIGDPIRNNLDNIVAAAGNLRSATDSSASDFNAGNLTASGAGAPMSTTISPGNVVVSTWGVTETATEFVAGAVSNISTMATPGSLTLIQSSSAAFLNAGAESNSTSLNWTANNFTAESSSLMYGNYWWRSASIACNRNFVVNVYDSAGTTLLVSTSVLVNDANLVLSVDTSYLPNSMIVLNVQRFSESGSPDTQATSVPFVRGKTIAVKIQDRGGCQIVWDIDETPIITSGTYSSQTYNTGLSTPTWGDFSATISSPTQTSLTVQTRVSTAAIGGFDARVLATNNQKIQSAAKQYILYVASFSVNSATNTAPILTAPTLAAATTGYFISQCRNTTGVSVWGLLTCSETLTGGGSISLAVATGSSCGAAINPSATWTNTPNGTTINVATAPYIAYRAFYNFDVSTQATSSNLAILDCRLEWDEGSARPPVASQVYLDRYYLAYTSSTATGAHNDHILVLDKNDKWTLFDSHTCYSLGFYNRKLYCGSSTDAGQVWLMDTGTDDDGAAILSRIRTKAFIFDMPESRKKFRKLYLDLEPSPDQSQAISLTARYTLERSTPVFSLGAVSLNEDPGSIMTSKFPFTLTNPVRGRYIQVELESNGLNSPWRLFGGRLYYSKLDPE